MIRSFSYAYSLELNSFRPGLTSFQDSGGKMADIPRHNIIPWPLIMCRVSIMPITTGFSLLRLPLQLDDDNVHQGQGLRVVLCQDSGFKMATPARHNSNRSCYCSIKVTEPSSSSLNPPQTISIFSQVLTIRNIFSRKSLSFTQLQVHNALHIFTITS